MTVNILHNIISWITNVTIKKSLARYEKISSKKGWIEFYEVAHEVDNYLK